MERNPKVTFNSKSEERKSHQLIEPVDTALDLIGNTPLISLKKMTGLNLYAKAEFLNPGGSIKDRVALFMIEEAEKRGQLKPGMTIMEPTSGNTGIGLAFAGVQKGYKVVIVMPENMSEERKKIIVALGAELVLTPAEKSIAGAVEEAEKRAGADSSIFVPQQFENPDNPQIHYLATAKEIWEQLDGRVDIFVSGLGSGGTLCGVGRFLKEKNPNSIVAAVEPKNVSALLGHEPGLHKIQGIGDGFVPPVLDTSLVDEVVEVTDDDAIQTARNLAKMQGLLVGTSSGANVWASMEMAKKYGKDKIIATVMADRAERYFSTALM
ncbi:MAG: cysteine synthase A [Firmicutes bacterium]|nr:cysteine synthase A [Bacillota bacterium]